MIKIPQALYAMKRNWPYAFNPSVWTQHTQWPDRAVGIYGKHPGSRCYGSKVPCLGALSQWDRSSPPVLLDLNRSKSGPCSGPGMVCQSVALNQQPSSLMSLFSYETQTN